ncbi:hypothetical protein [Aurantiacibacter sediminis]|uniref:Uncharacterized protein n=1 Tax=Aurantiacibacter sediminis TaxID=2793064 RepID=A0ABS0N370_9SPHN|nr:hypothetical protein [Aurantiacibacter sediminis]MBH5322416.1 hypothetical protein [Aurantiacibacter sediminis]
MIEVIPMMLFILGWHPDQPGQIDLQRPEIIFLSLEECEAEGARMAARMTEAARGQSDVRYEHRCMALPQEEEFETAFEQLDRSGR